MALTVKLPKEEAKEEYSIYVSGNVLYSATDAELGTLMKISGTGVAFYSSSNSRRAVIFQELSENHCSVPLIEGYIPYIKEKVRIIYKARGRKVDLLKFMVFNLEKEYKKEVYSLGIPYWLTLASYIDSLNPKDKGSKKRQEKLITDIHLNIRDRANEN